MHSDHISQSIAVRKSSIFFNRKLPWWVVEEESYHCFQEFRNPGTSSFPGSSFEVKLLEKLEVYLLNNALCTTRRRMLLFQVFNFQPLAAEIFTHYMYDIWLKYISPSFYLVDWQITFMCCCLFTVSVLFLFILSFIRSIYLFMFSSLYPFPKKKKNENDERTPWITGNICWITIKQRLV